MPLKRSSLGEIGYNTHAVSSLPTIIPAEIWITTMKAHLNCKMCLRSLNFSKESDNFSMSNYLALTGCLMPEERLVLRAVAIDAVLWGI